jgi:glycosyltransferase involved in cell wall biosynthesis
MNARWSVGHAASITTVSEWSRAQILDVYDLRSDQVHIVPNGVEPEFRPLAGGDLRQWERLLDRVQIGAPYLVAFGGAPRRGTEIALAAWRILRSRGYPHELVILDDDGPTEPGLSWFTRPSHEELRLMLAGGDLLLYPTETESFGLPGLEAAACGTPPVCPRVGALPEVLGDAAVWCEREAESVAEVAGSVLGDASALATFRESGRACAAKWTWDAAAERLLSVYKNVNALA